ncbi:MAG: hypothetical protein ACKVOQ_00290 [Cyclobacteriaceae bacterium]|jgi:hypothetical protein
MKNSIKFSAIAAFVLLSLGIMSLFSFRAQQSTVNYKYMQISTVESIIPGGLGRSRILSTDQSGTVVEKELKNFYSFVGINFSNIANNDDLIVSRLNEFSAEGWELFSTNTGVSNEKAGGGIFITRYVFRKPM